ncbi:MAG: hypothetical protein ACYDFU_01860 [Nitrospirota bacterium]
MRESLVKIKMMLSDAGASDIERAEILSGLQVISEKRLAELFESLSEDKKLTSLFLKNYREKRLALADGDNDAWERIIEEEKTYLEKAG